MSDTKDKEEPSRDMPLAVNESQQLVDGQGQPQASSDPVPIEETVNHVDIGKVAALIDVKNEKPEAISEDAPQQEVQDIPVEVNAQILVKTDSEHTSDVKTEVEESQRNTGNESGANACENHTNAEIIVEVKPEACNMLNGKNKGDSEITSHTEPTTPPAVPVDTKAEMKNGVENKDNEKQATASADNGNSNSKHLIIWDADHSYNGNVSGTEEDQSAFMKELENFFRERSMEFKPPKFYGEGLNCLNQIAMDPTARPSQPSSFPKLFKQQNRMIRPSVNLLSYSPYVMHCGGLWRAVTRLGGYDKVTSCKLWRQVGESFKPPKTCTTVSWTFRGFYEKALLDYERHKTNGGELTVPIVAHTEPMIIENQALASGRARRDAAARAMQGWHSQRLLANGEVSDPIIKDRNSMSLQKREKQLKSISLLKRKKPSYLDNAVKAARSKPSKPQLHTSVIDIGPPADWVKINVQKTKDCFEVYALVPGLLREEVRVQSDPAGRLVISGEPEHPDNPWGVTPFKKIVSLPLRIDPHHTSAVVTLHGQLFVRVPFEQSE